MTQHDPHDLERFVTAQARDFDSACRELKGGSKRSHWIWYIFPQMKGLGLSANAEFYGIASLVEARDYLAHPLLGPRLEAVTMLMLDQWPRTPSEVLGSPDDLKFCSSMTLFARAAGPGSLFRKAIDKLCNGREDLRTVRMIERT